MNEKPNFYSVIPASVRYDKKLSSSEKLFYSELTAMSNQNGFCWASNGYFAELYSVSKSTISMWVKKLELNNHIVVKYETEGNQIIKREIYPIQKIEIPYTENLKGGSQKIERGYTENLKENNININNINTNNIDSRKTSFSTLLSEICFKNEISKETEIEFFEYWSEHGANDKKMRFEKEKSFDINLRLKRWIKNEKKWQQKKEKLNAGEILKQRYGIN